MNELTKNELEIQEEIIVLGINGARQAVFLVREKELYRLGGFTSFEAWGESRFGFGIAHLKRLVAAERIQLSLQRVAPIGAPLQNIPEGQLRELGKAPEEERAAIYAQARADALAEGEMLTARRIKEAVDAVEKRAKLSNDSLKSMSDASRVAQQKALERAIALESEKAAVEQKLVHAGVQMAALRNQEPIFVPNDDEAMKQIQANADAQIRQAKLLQTKAEQELDEIKRTQHLTAANIVQEKLASHQSEIDRLAAQETAIAGRVAITKREMDALESCFGNKKEYRQSLDKFNQRMRDLAVDASVLLNSDPPDMDEYLGWQGALAKALDTLTYFNTHLNALDIGALK